MDILKKRIVIAGFFLLALVAAMGQGAVADALLLKVESTSAADAYLETANYLYKQGLYEEAERAYAASLQIEESEKARHNLGILYYTQGKSEKAETEFRKAILLNPQYVKGHNSLGLLAFEQGRFKEAAEHLRKVTELDGSITQAHFDAGVALANAYRQGEGTDADLEEAHQHFMIAAQEGYPHAQSNALIVNQILNEMQ